jgi:RNA polymerase sigma factor (sigma-70 family)
VYFVYLVVHLFQRFLSGFAVQRVFTNEQTMSESRKLLKEYVSNHSEAAFRELVERYVNLVHSVALRLAGGDTHLAEDVTQIVFGDLAAMAPMLPEEVLLGGWLHQHTCFVTNRTLRTERRRRIRERQAAEMNSQQDHTEANLARIAPILDEAIGRLGTSDRTAIILRYFEQYDLRSVGEALGTSDDAARKRVDRALEKLHVLLKHRGATLSAAALGTALATEAVTAAPAGLAGSVAGAALASAAAGEGITATLVRLMTMTKIKFGIISLIAVAGVATLLAIQHQSQAGLSPEREARSVCINNLRHIDGAIQQYALDNKLGINDTVSAQQVLSYLNDANVMRCPLGGTYTFGRVGDRPSCSIPGHVLPSK